MFFIFYGKERFSYLHNRRYNVKIHSKKNRDILVIASRRVFYSLRVVTVHAGGLR